MDIKHSTDICICSSFANALFNEMSKIYSTQYMDKLLFHIFVIILAIMGFLKIYNFSFLPPHSYHNILQSKKL